jgi:hypothetical protein
MPPRCFRFVPEAGSGRFPPAVFDSFTSPVKSNDCFERIIYLYLRLVITVFLLFRAQYAKIFINIPI